MVDEDISNREQLKTKIVRYDGKPPQQKTERRQSDRPPLQRPLST